MATPERNLRIIRALLKLVVLSQYTRFRKRRCRSPDYSFKRRSGRGLVSLFGLYQGVSIRPQSWLPIETTRAVLYRESAQTHFLRKKPPMTKREFAKIAAAAVALSGAAAAVLVAPALGQNLPDGNGKEVVQTICTACHDLSPITDAGGFSRADWETVVKSMIDM